MIEFKNSFHGTSVEIKGAELGSVLPRRLTNKIADRLCPDDSCSCHKIHGIQKYALEYNVRGWKVVLQENVMSELKEFTNFS
jgi:hypothetical protein